MRKSEWPEAVFFALLSQNNIDQPEKEVRFDPKRRWRFDYAWPGSRVALEVEGGVYTGGRHVRGAGYEADMEKYSEAASRGWLVLRTTPSKLVSVETVDLIRRTILYQATNGENHG